MLSDVDVGDDAAGSGAIAVRGARQLGVTYDPSGVWHVLHRMGWSCQKPERRAPERDEEAIAKNFLYTLYDNKSNEVIWLCKQAESSPSAVWIHDSGSVVVYAGASLFELEQDSGKKGIETSIFDQFTRAEYKRYVVRTTAGLRWTSNSLWYFAEHDGHLLFVVRTWWDRRIVLNLTKNRLVQPADKGVARACNQAKKERILTTLENARLHMLANEGDLEHSCAAQRSIHLARILGRR